jgi:hypothetical protein
LETNMENLLPHIATLGVGGLIAFVLIWRTIPGMLETFKAEMRDEREAHSRHVEAIIARLERIEGKLAACPLPWPALKKPGEPS